jgi:hypothetical protein
MTSEAGSLAALSRTVFANWTGGGADAAYGQITAVTKFASSVATAAATIGKGCKTAASYVTNAKAGINVVLVHLDNLTKGQILIGLADPLQVPACLLRILELRTRAKAIISAYSEALAAAMASIPFAVTIKPRPGRGSGSTDAAIAGSADVLVLKSAPLAGTWSTAGTASAVGTASATTTSTASTTGGWTACLAAFQVTDVAGSISKVPLSTDVASSPAAGAKAPGAGATPTGTSGTTGKKTGSSVGSTPSGTAPAIVPTGNPSDLIPDLGALASDMGQTPPTTPNADPTSGPGTASPAPGRTPAGAEFTSAITNNIIGTGSPNDVAAALDHRAWSGHAESVPQGSQPAPTSSVSSGAQGTVSSGTTSADGGARQTWGSGGPAHAGGGSAVSVSAPSPVSGSNPAPVGTGAASSDGSATSATIQNTSPQVAPVMPVTNTTTMFNSAPSGGVTGPSIQIAPGTMMSSPTTGLAGAPTGNNLFPASTNVPPVGNLSAPAAAVPSSAVPPTPVPASTPAAAPAAQPIAPREQAGPSTSAAQPLRIDASGGTAPGAIAPDAGVLTVAAAIAALGLVGAAAQHFTGLWHDLGSTTLLRPAGTLLPTQFGRDDELLAAMPVGMETVYQKVLLPGEVDQLLAGQWETLRGLVYPYQAVRELRRPSELYDALGLGFAVSGIAGSETLAFNRDAESVEVLRCAGLRQDDLVTPIDTDVKLPAGTVPLPLVRHHRRPWTGTGEAPGSTSDNVIEEHEILGYASVGIPHLAEIWRLHADGSEEYVSTYNARNGQWVGDTSPRLAPVGRKIDNGAYAGLSDGTVFRTVVLTDRESVLIAYGVSAPEHFELVHDGSYRTIVSNSDIISVTGVATIGAWRSLHIQLLSRQGDMVLVDYAGDDPAAAAAAGFLQTNQGQWQPRWVEHTEVTDLQQLERAYALPRPAEAWHVAPQAPESGPDAPHDDPLTEEVALGAAR